jgi:glycerol uptake facilitator-like aquaporin
LAILITVTLATTSNALPDDGVTSPKHVGAVLISILLYILKFLLRKFTGAAVGE